jgi:hypothetical protein
MAGAGCLQFRWRNFAGSDQHVERKVNKIGVETSPKCDLFSGSRPSLVGIENYFFDFH